jgi:phospholipase C
MSFTRPAGRRWISSSLAAAVALLVGGAPGSPARGAAPSKISHIVIIVQENRSFDNLFMGFPGADTATSGTLSTGETVELAPHGFALPRDVNHSHGGWYKQYAGGKMYFDLGAPLRPRVPYSYVPRSETGPYWQLAQRYTLGDRMFQSNTGPSYPAHLYLIAGSSEVSSGQYADENPSQENTGAPRSRAWGCDEPQSALVALLGEDGGDKAGVYPCFDMKTLGDELDDKGVSWRYYAPGIGGSGFIWSAYDSIKHIRYGKDWDRNVISPETNILGDVARGTLASVTWVAPSLRNSDHAGSRSTDGPQWVASIVNAIGKSKFWDSTAILIVWDDWGGWYDHVPPPQLDSMGLGFRVPLIVVSPYAKRAYVSHERHEFGSLLKFAEKTFGVGPLAASDARADDLSDCFDFDQAPSAYQSLAVKMTPADFAMQPPGQAPDDD